jgi:hypothetical protein
VAASSHTRAQLPPSRKQTPEHEHCNTPRKPQTPKVRGVGLRSRTGDPRRVSWKEPGASVQGKRKDTLVNLRSRPPGRWPRRRSRLPRPPAGRGWMNCSRVLGAVRPDEGRWQALLPVETVLHTPEPGGQGDGTVRQTPASVIQVLRLRRRLGLGQRMGCARFAGFLLV